MSSLTVDNIVFFFSKYSRIKNCSESKKSLHSANELKFLKSIFKRGTLNPRKSNNKLKAKSCGILYFKKRQEILRKVIKGNHRKKPKEII